MTTAFPGKHRFQLAIWAAAALAIFFLWGFSGSAGQEKKSRWVGTWSAAPQLVEPQNRPPLPGLTDHRLRQVICVSLGGETLRMKFSNEFSMSDLEMKRVEVAVSKGDSSIDASTVKVLKFKNNASQVTIRPGSAVFSEPFSFNLAPRMKLAVTITFGQAPADITGHPGSRTTSYLFIGSDATKAIPMDHWYVINKVEVEAQQPASAVVILGNSITDGRGSGTNRQDRWPDVLATRLLENESTKQTGVLNMGIGGNCVLTGGLGPTALDRFDRDVLGQNGVRWLIILEGVNDLGSTTDSASAADVAKGLTDAYDQMIRKAHAAGIKVYGATITPIRKSFYYAGYREAAREYVNHWIRTSGHFDAVIDFDRIMRDPQDTLSLLPGAQSGDFLHPNEKGYQMMGEAVPLSLFKR